MRRECLTGLALAALSAMIGAIGWSGHVVLLPTALFFPFLWSRAPSRWTASLVSAAYFLAASRELPRSVASFFAVEPWLGLALWIAAALPFVLVHTLFWTRQHGWQKALRYGLILVLTGLPPIGIMGWAHPLTAAGVLFPGFGWMGLLLMILVLCGLVMPMGSRLAPAVLAAWLSSVSGWTDPDLPKGWQGIDLQMGRRLGRDPSLRLQHDLVARIRDAAQSGSSVIVLPESALGFWTPVLERYWRTALKPHSVTVIAGAVIITENGYDNVMLAIDSLGGRIVYRQRMPVPVSMWRPWQRMIAGTGSTPARVFANPIVEIKELKVAPLICYEQLLVWPVLHSMGYRPDLIVLIGNGWWTDGSNIVAIQKASATAWAKLFGIPVISAFNL
ncbi:MAG: conjugal transfer protein TraB [Rhizobiaceae bacterium]|nr:conjugal transfer protein TraB [Rhizobiaceae bacterium]MCZ8351867.1 conjugal transfer protein TraB [Rhizobium sp.]